MQKSAEFDLDLQNLDKIVQILPKFGIILLQGDLASGKTTLVKKIAQNHGYEGVVSSPTFSVMQNYNEIYHYDIYNDGFGGIAKNGLFETLFEDGLHIIEWADSELIEALNKFEMKFCLVKITNNDANTRKYEVFYA